jgi:hypothetical protein
MFLLPAAVSAQETYRITLKQPDKGDTALYRKVTRLRMERTATDPNAKETSTKIDENTQDTFFGEEVLEKPAEASRGFKLLRDYRRAEQSTNGVKQLLPYDGMAIRIDKQDGRYRFRTWAGKALTPQLAKELREDFTSHMARLGHPGGAPCLLPKAAVQRGESWTIDPAGFVQQVGKLDRIILEPSRAIATGKLLRTYRKEGRQHGVLELRLEVPIRSFRTGGGELLKPRDRKLTVRTVVDACIDGSSFAYRLKGRMEYDLEGILQDGDVTLDFRARFQGDFFESWQEASKE